MQVAPKHTLGNATAKGVAGCRVGADTKAEAEAEAPPLLDQLMMPAKRKRVKNV